MRLPRSQHLQFCENRQAYYSGAWLADTISCIGDCPSCKSQNRCRGTTVRLTPSHRTLTFRKLNERQKFETARQRGVTGIGSVLTVRQGDRFRPEIDALIARSQRNNNVMFGCGNVYHRLRYPPGGLALGQS